MAAPTTAAPVKKSLANPEPSTHGESCRSICSLSVGRPTFGGVAGFPVPLPPGVRSTAGSVLSSVGLEAPRAGRSQPTEAIEAACDFGVFGAKHSLANRQGALQERPRPSEVAMVLK
jgi:hypothetical protein